MHIQGVTEALTKADIRKHLNSLTADLGQAFKGSLHRINKQSVRRKQVALRALTWVSTTYRSILAEELCHALATEIGDRALDEDAILTPKLIVDSCLGLIYIEESTSQVYLVHLALKEHLQAEKLISEDTMDAQTYVTNTLLTYLCLNEEDKDRYDESLPQLRRELCLSFYTYATCNWGFHARLASPNLIRKHALRYLQKEHAYARGLTSLFEHISTKSERVPIYTLTDLAQVPHQLTGLHVAAAFGLSTLVQDLLDLGIEVDALDEQRNTALHVASANGQTEAAIVLLQSNAKVNISNIFAHTPLYDAVIMSQEALVSELLNRGAAAEVKCAWEWSPLQKAADKGDLTIAKLLIKHGASIMSRSARGLIPLHRAAGQGHLEMIKELLKAGSPVDSQTVDGWSPLHGACSAGQTKAVNLLITNHANVNLQSFNGCTALHRACRRNHYQIVQALVEHGANLLCQNSEGDIPLHQAAKGNSLVICKFLIRHANSSAPLQLRSVNNFHRTPREEASYHGYRHVADELQQHELENGIIQGTEMSDLEMAVKDHNLPCLKMLLAGNSDADFGKLENLTLLHLALLLDDEDISRYLMGLPTVNIASVTVDGWQPLHCAANVGNSTLVELCLDHGAPVSAKTSDGQTPLHKACQTGDLDCVELLLDAGADVNADDVCGLTPLHTASSAGFQSIVELLISHGAKINVRDKSLRTPQICAAEAGNHAICQFWRQRHNPEWNFRRAAASQEL